MAEKVPIGQWKTYKCTDALDDHGYVLKLTGVDEVAKTATGVAQGDAVLGIAKTGTFDYTKVPPQAVANEQVAVITEGIVEVKIYSTTNLSAGTIIGVKNTPTAAGAGVATSFSAQSISATPTGTEVTNALTELRSIVGILLEDLTFAATGEVKHGKVLLRLFHSGR